MNTLKTEKRDMSIKAKRLRREGYVTGNIFGRDMKESIPLKIQKKDVDHLLKESGKGSTLLLDIEGEKYNALIKDIQYNPLKREIDEIDFQALVSDEQIHSVAEIVLLNHEKVLTGVVQLLTSEIAYKALPAALIDKIEIDVGNMHAGDCIKVKDLAIASNKEVSLTTDLEATVVVVTEFKNKGEQEPEEATEEE